LTGASLPAQQNQQGGARKRLLTETKYGNARLHPDAQNAFTERLEKIL
jgi:hypothetical protein